MRIGLAIEAPDATAFFHSARVLLIGETNNLTAEFSSTVIAQRSRLRSTPEMTSSQEATKDELRLFYTLKVPETAIPGRPCRSGARSRRLADEPCPSPAAAASRWHFSRCDRREIRGRLIACSLPADHSREARIGREVTASRSGTTLPKFEPFTFNRPPKDLNSRRQRPTGRRRIGLTRSRFPDFPCRRRRNAVFTKGKSNFRRQPVATFSTPRLHRFYGRRVYHRGLFTS